MVDRRRFLFALAAAATLPVRAQSRRFSAYPFTLGVASGYPQPGRVVLWTRLAPEPLAPGGGMNAEVVPVRWEIGADESLREIVASGTAYATPNGRTRFTSRPWGCTPRGPTGTASPPATR